MSEHSENDGHNYEGDETSHYSASVEITLPNDVNMMEWNVSQMYGYQNHIADYEDLEAVNRAVSAARTALFKATQKLNEVERNAVSAKTRYERNWRRYYLQANAKTDAQKRIYADLASEPLEDDYIVNEQLAKEINRMAMALRSELQALQGVSNNIRQQVKG